MRADIQTLRALAVLLVLLWHAGLPWLPGGYVGVDVFFVISGFLMTRIILTEIQERGRLDLPRFYLRRARRLFPAAGAALLGTAVITVTLLPATRWPAIAGDIGASALYLVNWRLAERSVDYLSADAAPSPLQHFWSLAVEEQFYLLWPVLLMLVLPLARPRRSRAAVALTLLVVLVSLGWSAWLTQTDPGRAFFVTTTRVWELALGALVAALWTGWAARAPRPGVATGLVVVGIGAILASAVLFDTATAFPGTSALVPTLGTAAVLLGGPFVRPAGPAGRVLALPPLQWVGGLSYSLYLWHWPMLVGAAALTGGPATSWPVGLLVVAASVLPAWLSLRFVEQPFRGHLPRTRTAVTGRRVGTWVGGYALTAAVCAGAVLVAPAVPGLGGPSGTGQDLRPAPAQARDDVYAPFYDGGCDPLAADSMVTVCVGGDPEGDRTVVVVGDSHAVMWMPAFDAAGDERGWRVELMAREACPAADVTPMLGEEPRPECPLWLDEVTEHLVEQGPDVVVTAHVAIPRLLVDGQEVRSVDGTDEVAAGLLRTWGRMRTSGAQVVSMTPTPRFEQDQPECVVQHLDDLSACGAPADSALALTGAPVERALREAPWVATLDLTPSLCPQGTCPAVTPDGVLAWTDTNHLSRTRALQLADPLGEQLAAVLDDPR